MLLGHWQEMKALGQASGALDALAALLPDDRGTARRRRRRGGRDLGPPGRRPRPGALGRPRARRRNDRAGEAELDESMITGESRPVAKAPGDRVVAGTVATDSSIRVRVDAIGDDTALAGIRRLVADAQASRSRAQALADRFAAMLFWAALAAGALTAIVWTALGDADAAVERDRDGPRHRLPACPRSGDPVGDRDLDRDVGPRGHPREGPPRARAHAYRRRGPVRQDRDPHRRTSPR